MTATWRSARVTGAVSAVVAAQLLPAITTVPLVRSTLWPQLAGIAPGDHVALTFDDGPDHSTSSFLDLLEQHCVTATFFVLGSHVAEHSEVVSRMHTAGHEIAVHGWNHRCLALRVPGGLRTELTRTSDAVEDVTGIRPRRYRPPYGVLTLEELLAARRTGLEPVLWSAWGRDWAHTATPAGIVATVARGRTRGGTVLLHDSDRTSAAGSWRHTLSATEVLLHDWQAAGLRVGPLTSH